MPTLDDDQRPLDLLATRYSPRLDVRVMILDAGSEMTYDPVDWIDTIVEAEAGTIEVETRDGATIELHAGAVFWLAGLPVRALRNRSTAPAVLVTASRRTNDDP